MGCKTQVVPCVCPRQEPSTATARLTPDIPKQTPPYPLTSTAPPVHAPAVALVHQVVVWLEQRKAALQLHLCAPRAVPRLIQRRRQRPGRAGGRRRSAGERGDGVWCAAPVVPTRPT